MNNRKHTIKKYKKLLTRVLLFSTLLIVLLNVGGQEQTVQAQDSDANPITLIPGECVDDTIAITLGESPIPKLDVLFLIDLSTTLRSLKIWLKSQI